MNDDDATERFYSLVWPQRAVVLRVAQLLAGDTPEAEDLAQETLLKAFRKIGSFHRGTNVKGWLFAILRNTHVDRVRAVASGPSVSLGDLVEELTAVSATNTEEFPAASPQAVFDAFSDQQVIDALRKLPEEIRWTLLLVDVEGLNQQDAAEVLQVPIGTIKSRAHRGRSMLHDWLMPLARDRRLVRD